MTVRKSKYEKKNNNKKHWRMTDKVIIIVIKNRNFKINSAITNSELNFVMIIKYHITDNLRLIMSVINIIWLQEFETSLQYQFIADNLCN